jgi:hypothetical protein
MPSAIDADALAGDKVRFDEEQHRFGDFFGTALMA